MATTSVQSSQSLRRRLSEENYKNAARALQKVIPKEIATKITIPDFTLISKTAECARVLADIVEKLIQERNEQRAKEYGVGNIVISWFRASYPFANLFLTILKDGTQVSQSAHLILTAIEIPILNPYGLLFGGLLVLMKVCTILSIALMLCRLHMRKQENQRALKGI